MALWEKSFLSREKSNCQGPEVRTVKEANMGRGRSKEGSGRKGHGGHRRENLGGYWKAFGF